jgi:ribosomal protein S18 acetylase RimI-like enzyme
MSQATLSPAWRVAAPADDDAIVAMCMTLNQVDPGPTKVSPEQVRATLGVFRREPTRGRALVLDQLGVAVGYGFLVSFWSNELGGQVCVLDELFVKPPYRGRGAVTELVEALAQESPLGLGRLVALALEVSDRNQRARELYERLGFEAGNRVMTRVLRPSSQ